MLPLPEAQHRVHGVQKLRLCERLDEVGRSRRGSSTRVRRAGSVRAVMTMIGIARFLRPNVLEVRPPSSPHGHVQDETRRGESLLRAQKFLGRGERLHPNPNGPQESRQRLPNRLVVVDEAHDLARCHGLECTACAPPTIIPWYASANCRSPTACAERYLSSGNGRSSRRGFRGRRQRVDSRRARRLAALGRFFRAFLRNPRRVPGPARVGRGFVLGVGYRGSRGTNGLDLQQALTESRPDMPVVVMTGHGDIPRSVRAMKAGAIEFLTKPFSDAALLAGIERALSRSRQCARSRPNWQTCATLRAAHVTRASSHAARDFWACSTSRSPPSWVPVKLRSRFNAPGHAEDGREFVTGSRAHGAKARHRADRLAELQRPMLDTALMYSRPGLETSLRYQSSTLPVDGSGA